MELEGLSCKPFSEYSQHEISKGKPLQRAGDKRTKRLATGVADGYGFIRAQSKEIERGEVLCSSLPLHADNVRHRAANGSGSVGFTWISFRERRQPGRRAVCCYS